MSKVNKKGLFYSNTRNLGLVYKYFGVLRVTDAQVSEVLTKLRANDVSGTKLSAELIIKNRKGVKTYYLTFFYGHSMSLNKSRLYDKKQEESYYSRLLNLKTEIESNIKMFQNGVIEYLPDFEIYPAKKKSSYKYITDELKKEKSDEVNEIRRERFKTYISQQLENSEGLNASNYLKKTKSESFSENITANNMALQNVKLYKNLGYYTLDDTFYYPYMLKYIPIISGKEAYGEINFFKIQAKLDEYVGKDIFQEYNLRISITPTNSISGVADGYRLDGGNNTYKLKGLSERDDFYAITSTLGLFSREGNLLEFLNDFNATFKNKISLHLPRESTIEAEESLLNINDSTNSVFYGNQTDVKNILTIAQKYYNSPEDGVYLGVDYNSGNSFKFDIFDHIGMVKGDKGYELQGPPHVNIYGKSGSGKTFFSKKFYQGITKSKVIVLDNLGNFQALPSDIRGRVYSYGYDVPSILGPLTKKTLNRELFITKRENKEEIYKEIQNDFDRRRVFVEDIEKELTRSTEYARKKLIFDIEEHEYTEVEKRQKEEELNKLNIQSNIHSILKNYSLGKIDEIICRLYKRRDRKIDFDNEIFIQTKEEMIGYLKTLPLGEEISIPELRSTLTDKEILNGEYSFPNIIGELNENTKSQKKGLFTTLLLGDTDFDATTRNNINGYVGKYFKENNFFKLSEFIKKLQEDNNGTSNTILNLIYSMDEKTQNILNRNESFFEDVLIGEDIPKMILDSIYISTLPDDAVKNTLNSLLIMSIVDYAKLTFSSEKKYRSKYKNVIFMIDEAHRYLETQKKGVDILKTVHQAQREGRNALLSLVLISQKYNDFEDTDLNGQTSYKIFLEQDEFEKHVQQVNKSGNLNKIEDYKAISKTIQRFSNNKMILEKKKLSASERYKIRFLLIDMESRNQDVYLISPKFT